MAQFEYNMQKSGSDYTLVLNGHIDEDVDFGAIDISGADTLKIDFDGITSINSCGIREWINWVGRATTGIQLHFSNCPKVIVDQINMVSGFLPKGAKVESFYVPYYSEDTDKEKMVLFVAGKNFTDSSVEAPESIKDEETGEDLELDVIESKYFKFLQAG